MLKNSLTSFQEIEIRRDVLQIYSYECEICRLVFNSMFDYLDHQETHNGQPVFGCYRCDQVLLIVIKI